MSKTVAAILSLSFLTLSALAQGQINTECPAFTKPSRAKIAPSPANPQYFRYNGVTQDLVGASNEYLCHVVQPGTFGTIPLTPAQDYCEFTNYQSYIDYLKIGLSTPGSVPQNGLNVIRLWLSLNSSPGMDRGMNRPYDHEGPFTNNCSPTAASCPNTVWNVGDYDDTYFDRLKCVLDYAWSRDVIVEVTLFDPWGGNFAKSPWNSVFSSEACFASKDFVVAGKRCDDLTLSNATGWAQQRALIHKVAQELCSYPNIYYEVANEVDLTSNAVSGLLPSQVMSWLQDMKSTLATEDGACGHYIAVNLHDDANLSSLGASVSVVNGHYPSINSSGSPYGAIELLRTRHNGGTPELNRIFGFNETKLVSEVTGNSFQTADPARAEAWEFMTSEGGIFDLYAERWRTTSGQTQTAINNLKRIRGLLSEVPLDRVSRSQSTGGAAPAWIVGLPTYPSTTTGSTRWGAMQSPMTQAGDANVLYIHHSTIELSGFQRYHAIPGTYGPEKFQVKLPAGSYVAEWVNTLTGGITSQPFTTTSASQAVPILDSPSYSYDIALRITRQ